MLLSANVILRYNGQYITWENLEGARRSAPPHGPIENKEALSQLLFFHFPFILDGDGVVFADITVKNFEKDTVAIRINPSVSGHLSIRNKMDLFKAWLDHAKFRTLGHPARHPQTYLEIWLTHQSDLSELENPRDFLAALKTDE